MADTEERSPRWHWRNLRSGGLELGIVPLEWRLDAEYESDVYGGAAALQVGPLWVRCFWDIGNCSAERGIQRWIGLSEMKAWERACRWEGITVEDTDV